MSKEAAQKNIQERIVYLTDLPYIYNEIKMKHNFQEAMKYKDFWGKLTKKNENAQIVEEHNIFNLSDIIRVKNIQELINSPSEIYFINDKKKDFFSEVATLMKKSKKIVLITKPSALNFLLLDEVINIHNIARENHTIYYIPVKTLKTDFINDKCFFVSHADMDNIVVDEEIIQTIENTEKYIGKSHEIIRKLFKEDYITKIVNTAYLYGFNLDKTAIYENRVYENDALYNLEVLQRELFLRYGINYKQSYKALEYLYSKGLITYYETNKRVLAEEQKNEILEIVNNNELIKVKKQKIKDIDNTYFEDLDDVEIGAIIPTTEVNKGYIEEVLRNKNFENDELKNTYFLIANSIKCIFNLQEPDEVLIDLVDKASVIDFVDYLIVCGFAGTEITYMLKDCAYINENGYIKKIEEKMKYINDYNLKLHISEIYDIVKELRTEQE